MKLDNPVSNKKKTFSVEEEAKYDQEDYKSEDFIALESDRTDFKVLSSRDLQSDSCKGSDAWNFKERMLFGGRVNREPHSKKSLREAKLAAAGKSLTHSRVES